MTVWVTFLLAAAHVALRVAANGVEKVSSSRAKGQAWQSFVLLPAIAPARPRL